MLVAEGLGPGRGAEEITSGLNGDRHPRGDFIATAVEDGGAGCYRVRHKVLIRLVIRPVAAWIRTGGVNDVVELVFD